MRATSPNARMARSQTFANCPRLMSPRRTIDAWGIIDAWAPSTPGESSELPPEVRAQDSPARLVVFAADKAPGDPPDVAVGLALAPPKTRFLSSCPATCRPIPAWSTCFETRVERSRAALFFGGPRDNTRRHRALLRQVLRATDRQGFFGEVRTPWDRSRQL